MVKTKNQTKSHSKKGNITYPVGDFLIRIKNAALAGRKEVTAPTTKFLKALSDVLKQEGFLSDVSVADRTITVNLRFASKKAVLMSLELVSRPGLRRYAGIDELKSLKGPEVYIVSTSQGIMSVKNAIKKNLGGEIIVKLI